nr:AAA family ATPase [Chloroflexota bacterium]
MRLIAFSVEGYRRFVDKTSVKLHGELIAFVGPNEAGKSSLLRALAHLNNDAPFEPNERPRRTSLEPRLTWHFQLEREDREALGSVPDAAHVERAVVTKRADGTKTWEFEPRRPRRDRIPRAAAAELLTTHRDSEILAVADDDEDSEFSLEDFDRVIQTLEADVENYEPGNLDGLRDLARRLRGVEYPERLEHPDLDDGEPGAAADHDQPIDTWRRSRDEMVSALEQVAASEASPSPWRLTVNALQDRLPRVLLFSDEDRELASQYDLTEVREPPPTALGHLASLADLDLAALRREALAQAVPDVATRRNAANRTLLAAFDQSWNQQGIAVQIEVQGSVLHVQATTPEDSGLSDIGERSDGMRWFAALLAYAHGWQDPPILLVDEIERHLHYDAQSDLVEVLSKQAFTAKVIYTTHSFGCLPHDLGTGVRVVQPLDAATSRLENGFWKRGSGFSPLLASMGAAAMSFTPTRHALIAEGAADAILLPTILRQATGERALGFQVAPGLSSVAAASVHDLEAEAGHVGFVVDGDEGGAAIVDKLVSAGVSRERVVVLSNDTDAS